MPPSHRSVTRPSAAPLEARAAGGIAGQPVGEEASFLEHRAALDATVLAPVEGEELVLELHAGVLRGPL